MFDVRLRAYQPQGDALGLLPTPLDMSASFVHNDLGALTLRYSSLAAGGQHLARGLEQGLEIAVEVTNAAGQWVEPQGARFLRLASSTDYMDPNKALNLTLPSYGWLLRKARNLNTAALLPDEHEQAGKRAFEGATPGKILADLLAENSDRGGIALTRNFTASQDSEGNAWSKSTTLYFELGVELSTVLESLASQGLADWRTQGRSLRVFNPGVMAPDLSGSVTLHAGRDIDAAPSEESLEEVAGRTLIRGEGRLSVLVNNSGAPSPWGTWEGFTAQGGVTDEATARELAAADLERSARVRGEHTRSLVLSAPKHVPMVDYGPGAWITAPMAGAGERVRVQQVTITRGANGVGGSLVLNDRVLVPELRRAKRLRSATGGVGGTTGGVGGGGGAGGTGAMPGGIRPPGQDQRTPAGPENLFGEALAYNDQQGFGQGQITLIWDPVTTATDGTPLAVAGYEVQARQVGEETGDWEIIASADSAKIVHSPVELDTTWQLRVRARGMLATKPGAWSDPLTVAVPDQNRPPPPPYSHAGKVAGLESSMDIATSRIDGLTDRADAGDAKDAQQDARISGAESKNDAQDAQLGQQNSRLGQIETKNNQQDGRLSQLEANPPGNNDSWDTRQDGNLKDLFGRSKADRNQGSRRDQEIEKANRAIQRAFDERTKIRGDLAEIRERLRLLEKARVEMVQDARQVQRTIGDDKGNRRDGLKGRIKFNEEKTRNIETETDNVSEMLEDVKVAQEEDRSIIRWIWDEWIPDIDIDFGNVWANVSSQGSEIRTARGSASTLNGRLNTMTSATSTAQSAANAAQSTANSARSSIDNAAGSFSSLQGRLNNMSSGISSAQSSASSAQSTANSARSSIDNAASPFSSLNARLNDMRNATTSAQNSINNAAGSFSSMNARMNNMTSRIGSLESNISQVASAMNNIATALSQLYNRVRAIDGGPPWSI